ncbi:MAG: Mg2+ transporter MgtE [Planctomycetaceae bacterium]|nr:Mg2+ transporter MgtE [Planctomycetaceae bacterium]
MHAHLALPEVRELIDNKDLATLSEILNEWLPADLASLLHGLRLDEQDLAFRVLTGRVRPQTFAYLDLDTQLRFLKTLPPEEASALLNEMADDDRTSLLSELPTASANQILAMLSPEQRTLARKLLDYAPDAIGRHMTPHFVAVKREWTVQRVLEFIRTHGIDSETLNVIYVVDENHKLIDDIRIREILLAPPQKTVSEIMNRQFVTLQDTDDKRTGVEVFKKYDRTALPVVNRDGILVGVVTIDDVMDIAEQAATQEIQKFGGLEALEEPYVTTPFWTMVKKRASWLVVLFFGELLTATAMGFFEKEIEKAVVLALFVPLIISSGGNSGSQAATLIVRALALGEIRLRDWWKVLGRELSSGFVLGVILGSIGFLRITLWSAFSTAYGEHWLLVAITVSSSLVGIVMWGTIAGSMLPFLLKKAGADPATSSAPFVATLVDVTGLVIYFSMAWLVLRGTLLQE